MLRSLVFISIIIITMLMAASMCVSQTEPVMIISFDENMDAQSSKGVISPSVLDKPELAPGRTGQALKSGPNTGYVEYPTALLKPTEGTVEMWICPLDWVPKDEEFHSFFDMRGPDGGLYLYKYYQSINLLMLSCNNLDGPYFQSISPLHWKPGEWHHIAGTWSSAGVMAYVDGIPAGPVPVEALLPKALSKTFRIGDHPWQFSRNSSSLIDDIRIYDRALSAAHVAAHFVGDYGFKAPLTINNLALQSEIDPVKQKISIKLNLGGADVADDQISTKIALVTKGEPIPVDLPTQKFTDGKLQYEVPFDINKVATYDLIAQVTPNNAQVMELRRDIKIPETTVWRNNKLGEEDIVLPPWTPVDAKTRNLVKVWDRKYDFRSEGLVGQIISGGQRLLASPVQLKQTINGKTTAIKSLLMPTKPASKTKAVVHKKLTQSKTHILMQTVVEYDGLAWFTLSGKIDPNVETLTLDIPVSPDIAIYRHRYLPVWNTSKVTGNLPAGNGVIDNDKFIPFYWLGNNDRGLFWMCESDEMWPNGDDPNALQVIREKAQVVLRLNLIAKGQKLPNNWKFAFGLQATPVKPIPADWRKWRLQPALNGNVKIMWPTTNKNSNRYYGYPEATDPALMDARVKELHLNNVSAVPYLCLSYISAACPEWALFRKYWAMGNIDNTSSDVIAYGAGFAMASPVGKDYADFIVWKTTQFIKQYGIDGLYHDQTHPYSSANLEAGCGYMRDGHQRPTYPILGFRQLYRRMYGIMKSIKPKGFTMAHMSGKLTIPILAYDDSYLDGEYFYGAIKDSYMDLMSLDTFRAEFMGRQWGIMPFFLPEFNAEQSKQVEPTRGLMALLMLHDVNPWQDSGNPEEFSKAFRALDSFGYVNAKFIGYFEKQAPGNTDMRDVYVSAYKKMDGKTLLVVSNLGKEDRHGEVSINTIVLKRAIKSIITWPDKQPIAVNNNKITLSIPRLGYQLLVIN